MHACTYYVLCRNVIEMRDDGKRMRNEAERRVPKPSNLSVCQWRQRMTTRKFLSLDGFHGTFVSAFMSNSPPLSRQN